MKSAKQQLLGSPPLNNKQLDNTTKMFKQELSKWVIGYSKKYFKIPERPAQENYDQTGKVRTKSLK